MRRALVAVLIVLSFLGLGAVGTQIGTTSLMLPQPIGVETALAAATDTCGRNYITEPQNSGGRIYYKANFTCSTLTLYKMTVYLCGGVNGSGYCGFGVSKEIFSNYLTVGGSCAVRYSGPYWLYTGVKIQSPNYYGQPANDRWFFGPGAWVQGSC